MFNADGKRLLEEKHTGTFQEQLRSLTAEKLHVELQAEIDKLAAIGKQLDEAFINGQVVQSKTLQNCLRLLKAYTDKIAEFQAKVDAHEEGFHLMTRNFFTDVNRLVINVPMQAPHRRAFVMPHEQDSRKKRKMPGPRKPEDKKNRRLRALKPQKVGGGGAGAKQPRKKRVPRIPRWQDQPYRQPVDTVPVKLERFDEDPTQSFVMPELFQFAEPPPPTQVVKVETAPPPQPDHDPTERFAFTIPDDFVKFE
jgi:hypothetical protein